MNYNSKNEPEQKLNKILKDAKKISNENQRLIQNNKKDFSNPQSNSTSIKNQIKEIPHLFANESEESKLSNNIQSKLNLIQSDLPTKIEQTYDFGKNKNSNNENNNNNNQTNTNNLNEESKKKIPGINNEIGKSKAMNKNISKQYEEVNEDKIGIGKIDKIDKIEKPEKIVKTKELKIEIIDGPENIMSQVNATNPKIEIGAEGLKLKGGGKKGNYNGYTYFGSGEIGSANANSAEQSVDYQLPNLPGISNVHFYIKYDNKIQKYFINNASNTFSTFLKIIEQIKLNSNQIVGIADTRIAINCNKNNTISIIYVIGSNKEVEKLFDQTFTSISVGRSKECTLQIPTNNLSRKQFILQFKNQNWYIIDGDGSKPSTNGTWLMIKNETELISEAYIRISDLTLKISNVNS